MKQDNNERRAFHSKFPALPGSEGDLLMDQQDEIAVSILIRMLMLVLWTLVQMADDQPMLWHRCCWGSGSQYFQALSVTSHLL